MSKGKKIILVSGVVAAIIAVCIALFILFAPLLINTDAVRSQVSSWIGRKTEGKVAFQRVGLQLFPFPRVAVSDVSATLPRTGALSAESVFLDLSLYPLLLGKVEITKVQIERPRISLSLPLRGPSQEPKRDSPTIDKVLAGIPSKFPGMLIVIDNGTVEVLRETRTLLALRDVDARISSLTEGVRADLGFSAGFAKEIHAGARIDPTDSPNRITLEIEGTDINVSSLRKTAFLLIEDNATVRSVFSYLRGGNVEDISVHMTGRALDELGGMDDLVIRGRLRGGQVFVAGAGLSFQNVSSDCSISDGVLHVEALSAGLNDLQLGGGSLTVGLKGEDAPFRLEADINTNFEGVSALLDRFLKKKSFPFNSLRDVRGPVAGRLVLGENIAMFDNWKEYGYVRFDGRISAAGGPTVDLALAVSPEGVDITKLNIKDGKSNAALAVHLGRNTDQFSFSGYLERKTIDKLIDLPHLPEGFIRGDIMMSVDRENLLRSTAHGTLFVEKMPIRLANSFACELEGVSLRAEESRLVVDGAMLTISGDSISMKGTADVSPRGVAVDMDVSSERIRWEAVSPLFSNGNGTKGKIDVTGMMKLSVGAFHYGGITTGPAEADISLAKERTGINVKAAMLIAGEDSVSVSGAINITKNDVSVDMDATAQDLRFENLKPFFGEDRPRSGGGNDGGGEGGVTGSVRLKVGAFHYGGITAGPVQAGISLSRGRTIIAVETPTLELAEDSASVSGTVDITKKAVDVDMDIAAKKLNFEDLKPFFGEDRPQSGDRKKEKAGRTPLTGAVRLVADTVIIGTREISLGRADISFAPNLITIGLPNVAYCGIKAPGKVGIADGVVRLNFRYSANDQNLAPAVACLTGERSDITGKFFLKGSAGGEGKGSRIVQSLDGDIDFRAEGGRINKSALFLNVYSLLNITGYFSGNIVDLFRKGISYRSITLKADIREGKLIITEANLDSTPMKVVASGEIDLATEKIDLRMLAVPLTTVDVVLGKIPLIGKAVSGSLVSLPITVTGDLNDPVVKYAASAHIGKGLIDLLKRTVKAPVAIVEPNAGKSPQ